MMSSGLGFRGKTIRDVESTCLPRMEFARRELEKTGWRNGCGLGKNETGISQAIKPTIKADTCGLGFDQSKDFSDNWWTTLFNRSAKKLTISKGNSGPELCVTLNSDDRIEEKKQCRNHTLYTGFVKSNGTDSNLHETGTGIPTSGGQTISDEQHFIACGGRTAHRAARHGLNLTGKLKRLAKQEQLAEKGDTLDCQDRKSKKRLRTDTESSQSQGQLEVTVPIGSDSDGVMEPSEHQSHRKKRTKHRQ